ncbi:MAG: TrkH family potassium uptake protein [bacterium]
MNYNSILKNRYLLIFRYISFLTMFAALVILTPLVILPWYPGELPYTLPFINSALIALATGVFLYIITRKNDPEVTLSLQEGGVIVVISWLLASIFFALPFILAGKLNFTQALFESVSGITTTGLSVVDVTTTPAVFLLWRSIMHFLGGAGLAVIMLSAIINPYGFGIYQAEGRSDQLLPHVKRSAKMIMIIYSGYVFSGIVIYYLLGMGLFDSINHSMAALSTGGFSTRSESIGYYNSFPIEIATCLLMVLGNLNFATHYVLLRGKFKTFFKNGEVKLQIFLYSLLIPLVAFLGLGGVAGRLSDSFRIAIFQVISALSTTGFSTVSFSGWPAFGMMVIILLMLIGGGAGSTAGGIKQFRIHFLFKSLLVEIKNIFKPKNAVSYDYVWRGAEQMKITAANVRSVANYVFLYMLLYFSGVLIFLSQGFELEESMFEFSSALGTVGLSAGIIGAEAPGVILWTSTTAMFLGRLEFMIIFISIVKIFKDCKDIQNQI